MKIITSSIAAVALFAALSVSAQAQDDRTNELHAYGYMVFGAGACEIEDFDMDKFGELVAEVAVDMELSEDDMTAALEVGSAAAEQDATADLEAFCTKLPELIATSPLAAE